MGCLGATVLVEDHEHRHRTHTSGSWQPANVSGRPRVVGPRVLQDRDDCNSGLAGGLNGSDSPATHPSVADQIVDALSTQSYHLLEAAACGTKLDLVNFRRSTKVSSLALIDPASTLLRKPS